MKFIKGIVLFCFLGISISGCFDPPVFSVVPKISYNKIQFKVTPPANEFDTLIIHLDFKDGDGDLGLNDNFLDEPFNDSFYYVADGLGDTTQVATEIIDSYVVLKKRPEVTGKLVTNRTRTEPNYGYLPIYDPNSCLDYAFTQIVVAEIDNFVDGTYNILDTLYTQFGDRYFVLEEALLYKKNVYHNNIDVKYWVFQNGNFVEYDWFKEFCIDFNGRFPVLTNQGGPLEGTIRYAMPNSSFLAIFSVKTLKLSFIIRDRALNESEEIFTPQFTLDAIRSN